MDEQLCHLFDETMNLIAPKPNFTFDDSEYLCYYRYRATEHLVSPENRKNIAQVIMMWEEWENSWLK